MSGLSGSAFCSIRYARRAPPHMASTTSLTVTPAACLIAITRSIGQDCAAQRRAPPIGTLKIVLGAPNGNVNCCSIRPLRASLKADGPSPAMDSAILARSPSRDDPGFFLPTGRSLVPQETRNSWSSGSVDIERRIMRIALTPSTSA